MTDPLNLKFYLERCECHHAPLGNAKIPPGYAVLIGEDGYTFWIGPNVEEGPLDWNKWRSLKRAKAHHAAHSQPSLL